MYTKCAKPISLDRFAIILLNIFLLSCAATTPVLEWRDESYTAGAFNHLLVIGISEDAVKRRQFEDSFVRELKALGVRATASYAIMPGDQKVEKETIIKAIAGRQVDAVLVTHLVGVEQKEAYMPRTMGPSYYGYYSSAYNYAYSPGYYEKYEVLKLESNLYSVQTEKPIWSMQSESLELDRVNTLINDIIKLNIKSLRNQNLI